MADPESARPSCRFDPFVVDRGPETAKEEFLETWKSSPEDDANGRYFVFFTRDTHEPVGYSAFYDYDASSKSAETANCVASEWKGRGFGLSLFVKSS